MKSILVFFDKPFDTTKKTSEVHCFGRHFFSLQKLFPLDGCRGFAGDVVHHAADTLHFVYDTRTYAI